MGCAGNGAGVEEARLSRMTALTGMPPWASPDKEMEPGVPAAKLTETLESETASPPSDTCRLACRVTESTVPEILTGLPAKPSMSPPLITAPREPVSV